MRPFKTVTDSNKAKEFIDEFLKQKWNYVYHQDIYNLTAKLYLEPENYLFGVFNKLVAAGLGDITLSIEDVPDKKYTRALVSRLEKNSSRDKKHFSFSSSEENFRPVKRTFEDTYRRALHVIKEVFDEAFINENNIDYDQLKLNVEKSKTIKKEEGQELPVAAVYRLEQVKNDLRIILQISSIDGDIKLSLGKPADKGIYNPVTGFFKSKFSYEPAVYNRFSDRNDMRFFEKQGFGMYPLAWNNKQFFNIVFNAYAEGDMIKIIKSSQVSMKKIVNKLLDNLLIFIGKDTEGKSLIKSGDQFRLESATDVPEELKSTINSFLHGSRCYSMPQYDIFIGFKPELKEYENDQSVLLASLNITVVPYDNMTHPDGGLFLHPIIYDADK